MVQVREFPGLVLGTVRSLRANPTFMPRFHPGKSQRRFPFPKADIAKLIAPDHNESIEERLNF